MYSTEKKTTKKTYGRHFSNVSDVMESIID